MLGLPCRLEKLKVKSYLTTTSSIGPPANLVYIQTEKDDDDQLSGSFTITFDDGKSVQSTSDLDASVLRVAKGSLGKSS